MTEPTPPADPPASELLTVKEISAWLNIDTRTVYRWNSAGRFPPPLRCGLRWSRWRRSDVEDWLAGRWRSEKK